MSRRWNPDIAAGPLDYLIGRAESGKQRSNWWDAIPGVVWVIVFLPVFMLGVLFLAWWVVAGTVISVHNFFAGGE